ncbi:MAG TPA: ABC transporter permease [Solirubrobacteraceae bacterium]|nr:ABC transporter permease [Solirubrobacteraceae bacterium]
MSGGLVVSSIALALAGGTAVLLAATGELLVERVGLVNIGIEGMMLVGALVGFIAAQSTHSALVGLLVGSLGGAGLALLYAVSVVVLRADMIMVGFALWFIGIGVTDQLGGRYVLGHSATISTWKVPLLGSIPDVGPALFRQPWLVYLAFFIPFGVHFLLTRTRHGLNMRAIGESPATADALGINVSLWRFIYVLVGGGFAGLGGAFLTLSTVHTWLQGVTAGQGWIALAIVIFARWRARSLILGAYLFGALQTLGDVAQAEGWSIPSEFFTALPYIGTMVMIIAISWLSGRRSGWSAWPAGLGKPFFRGVD